MPVHECPHQSRHVLPTTGGLLLRNKRLIGSCLCATPLGDALSLQEAGHLPRKG